MLANRHGNRTARDRKENKRFKNVTVWGNLSLSDVAVCSELSWC